MTSSSYREINYIKKKKRHDSKLHSYSCTLDHLGKKCYNNLLHFTRYDFFPFYELPFYLYAHKFISRYKIS